jgi:hypothetical protein
MVRSYSRFALEVTCAMIIGNMKLFKNACRMRYCVARILLQKTQSFFGDDAGGRGEVTLNKMEKSEHIQRECRSEWHLLLRFAHGENIEYQSI